MSSRDDLPFVMSHFKPALPARTKLPCLELQWVNPHLLTHHTLRRYYRHNKSTMVTKSSQSLLYSDVLHQELF